MPPIWRSIWRRRRFRSARKRTRRWCANLPATWERTDAKMAAVAGRYARAFAEVVMDHKLDTAKTAQELSEFAALVQSSNELHNVLLNPAVEQKQKLSLLDAIMKRMGAGKLFRNFVAVLIDHKRIGQIGEIAEEFRKELDQRMGIADARVSSARALTAAE